MFIDAGVQAILPDAVLLAVATAQPASSADLAECVHVNLSQLDSSKAPQDIVTKDVELCLQQHAEQVSHCIPLGVHISQMAKLYAVFMMN